MSEQCNGVTRSGARCKIGRNLKEGYCHLHLKQAPQNVEQEPVEEKSSSETFSLPQSSGSLSLRWKKLLTSFLAVIAGFVIFSVKRRKSRVKG